MTKTFRKITSALLVMAMCLSLVLCIFAFLSFDANAAEDHTYYANNFTALPDDWSLLAGSDTKNTKTPTFSNGTMKLWHNNPSDGSVAGPYWGAVYEIANGEEWSDFTFKMDFSLGNQNNNGRFIKVLFHTQKDDYLSGYGFMHRIDNRYNNALQKPNGEAKDLNEENSSSKAALTTNTPHTIIITASGSNAKYYLDGVLLKEWDVSSQYDALGGKRTSGGIALNINGCEIAISSLSITSGATDPTTAVPEPPESAVYTAQGGLPSYRADGVLTIKTDAKNVPSSYCIYWGDENGKLEDYNAFQKITATGTETKFTITPNTFIPEGADRLLVYSHSNIGGKQSETCATAMLDRKQGDFGKADMEVQILSDIHLTSDNSHKYNQNFVAALNDIKSISPSTSGIFIGGDIADGDMVNFNAPFPEQYTNFRTYVENAGFSGKVFPVSGNHDFFGWGSLGISSERDQKCIEQFLMGTELENMYYYKDIGGMRFIMLSSLEVHNDNIAYLGEEQIVWLEETILSAPEGPIILLLHQGLKDTVSGTRVSESPSQKWYGIVEADAIQSILKEYPQVIFFSGHSHERMEEAKTMYKDNGITAFGTASVAYIAQNGNGIGNGSQGYYVYSYDDKILIRGRDFENGAWIPEAQFVITLKEEAPKDPQPEDPTHTDPTPTDHVTDPTPTDDVGKKKGCGSTIGTTAAVVAIAVASFGAVALKKREIYRQ